jgi:RNA polymerase sigma factor (sigma-70 family)
MSNDNTADTVGHLRQLVIGRDGAGLSDGQLLECFLSRRDEAAFTALVRRHGPMVLGVCRRVLRNHHDAEDAFQATFLVLAGKAKSLRQRELLANWLYGVAYRTALKARAAIARRRAKERRARLPPSPRTPPAEGLAHELGARLDAALRHLPEKYRVAVVLCDLEGSTKQAAARLLGIPEGTVSSRLARARRRLAKELAPVGSIFAGGVSGLVFVNGAAAADVPLLLVRSTARAGIRVANGRVAVGAAPTGVLALTEEVMKAMMLSKLRRWAGGLLLLATLSLSAGECLYQTGVAGAQPPAPGVKAPATPPAAGPRAAHGQAKGGRLLFFSEGRLATVRPDGQDFQWLSGKNPGQRPPPGLPRLSPDGRRLASGVPVEEFNGTGETPYNIYIRGLSADDERELGVEGISWCWSPDGKELIVVRNDGANVSNVAVEVATRRQTKLPVPANHVVTDVSPDGKWLLTFSAQRAGDKWSKARLYVVKRDGSERRALTGPEEDASEGRFSPDGTKVLFYGTDPEKKKPEAVYVMDLTGLGCRRVSAELNAEIMGFCWSPDGKRVAYAWRQQHPKPENPNDPPPNLETESFLMVVDADGQHPVTVLSAKASDPLIITLADPDWR